MQSKSPRGTQGTQRVPLGALCSLFAAFRYTFIAALRRRGATASTGASPRGARRLVHVTWRVPEPAPLLGSRLGGRLGRRLAYVTCRVPAAPPLVPYSPPPPPIPAPPLARRALVSPPLVAGVTPSTAAPTASPSPPSIPRPASPAATPARRGGASCGGARRSRRVPSRRD